MQNSSVNKICVNSVNVIGKSSSTVSGKSKFDAVKFTLRSEVFPDPHSHITVTCLEYPQRITTSNSTAQGRAKRFNRRNNVRYMTQPVTLIEIKESEEDTASFTLASSNKNNLN